MRRKIRFPPTSFPQKRLYNYVKEKYPSALLNQRIPIPWKDYYYYPDILIPEMKVVIEYDGQKEHAKRKQKDIYRDVTLAQLGYVTIRINKTNMWAFVGNMEETVSRYYTAFHKRKLVSSS